LSLCWWTTEFSVTRSSIYLQGPISREVTIISKGYFQCHVFFWSRSYLYFSDTAERNDCKTVPYLVISMNASLGGIFMQWRPNGNLADENFIAEPQQQQTPDNREQLASPDNVDTEPLEESTEPRSMDHWRSSNQMKQSSIKVRIIFPSAEVPWQWWSISWGITVLCYTKQWWWPDALNTK